MYRSHFKTYLISWKVLKLLCNNFQNIGFEIVLKEVLEISLLRNYDIANFAVEISAENFMEKHLQ